MDYFGILKKAWDVTWRHKVLWILGFFAVASSGTSGGGGGSGVRWQESVSSADIASFETWVDQNLGLLIVLAASIIIIGIVMLLLGVAARGGLVHLVNEAEEGRPVRAGDGWTVGFRYWGRTFMIGFMLGLPIVALVVVMIMMLIGAGFGLAAGVESASPLAGLGFGSALCCMLPVFVVLLTGLGFLIGIIGELAVRYGVLHDVSFGKAIRRGWDDIWAKRGAAVMWLVMLLPQFAYGVVVVVFAFAAIVPAFLLLISGAVFVSVAIFILFVLLLMVPGAIYNTFYSASWTIFFRRMTGAEVAAVAPVAGVSQGHVPSSPPVDVSART